MLAISDIIIHALDGSIRKRGRKEKSILGRDGLENIVINKRLSYYSCNMVEKEPTPYDLRLWQYGVMAIIESGVKPSDLIRILNSRDNPEYLRVGWEAYKTVATPELKLRMQKVQEALDVLSKFDRTIDPRQ